MREKKRMILYVLLDDILFEILYLVNRTEQERKNESKHLKNTLSRFFSSLFHFGQCF